MLQQRQFMRRQNLVENSVEKYEYKTYLTLSSQKPIMSFNADEP